MFRKASTTAVILLLKLWNVYMYVNKLNGDCFMLTSLEHIQIPVRHMDRAISWYTDNLGFQLSSRDGDRIAFLTLQVMIMMVTTIHRIPVVVRMAAAAVTNRFKNARKRVTPLPCVFTLSFRHPRSSNTLLDLYHKQQLTFVSLDKCFRVTRTLSPTVDSVGSLS
jgi:hypothetical protein